ncbi:hypothetical protein MVES1_000118 [Malassezia vespertilionis]|uniref:Protein ROT1 n=1 Tax=Malassezia vespertilionis TaxID=2020962 RepID=A0A2N1JG01_9BASI|nr:uncharacterized protein MVES1_000118 [Malassezia vespertilionis]PKI85480.1 Rot1p [Malassezia vespertilionis]WFD04794.1 hypothetical protein MVES1_000118 [Malassezia vespertilionis]
MVYAEIAEYKPLSRDLRGTWSSGSQQVLTGADRNDNVRFHSSSKANNQMFYNPYRKQFTVPRSAGISYSFLPSNGSDNEGFFEEARFQYQSDSQNPHCFSAQLIWLHGRYKYGRNNLATDMTLSAYPGDSMIQTITNPECTGGKSVETDVYTLDKNQEYIKNFTTFIENDAPYPQPGSNTKAMWGLQMYQFDGAPLAKMYLKYDPPQMLPTEQMFVQVIGVN